MLEDDTRRKRSLAANDNCSWCQDCVLHEPRHPPSAVRSRNLKFPRCTQTAITGVRDRPSLVAPLLQPQNRCYHVLLQLLGVPARVQQARSGTQLQASPRRPVGRATASAPRAASDGWSDSWLTFVSLLFVCFRTPALTPSSVRKRAARGVGRGLARTRCGVLRVRSFHTPRCCARCRRRHSCDEPAHSIDARPWSGGACFTKRAHSWLVVRQGDPGQLAVRRGITGEVGENTFRVQAEVRSLEANELETRTVAIKYEIILPWYHIGVTPVSSVTSSPYSAWLPPPAYPNDCGCF